MKEDLTKVTGVGPVTAQKLFDRGVRTVADLAALSDKKLVKFTEFPLSRASVIRQNALVLLADSPESDAPVEAKKGTAKGKDKGRDKKTRKTKSGKSKKKGKDKKKDRKKEKKKKEKKSKK